MLTSGGEAHARALALASPDIVLFPLPRWFVHAVFLLLPVDTRLRCREVNRAWRGLLDDTTFWARIDASVSSGLRRFSEALLRAAVAKAGGQLRALDITGRNFVVFNRLNVLLLEVAAANAATLTELRVATVQFWSAGLVRALLETARQCLLLDASVSITRDRQVARAMLRNEPPFQALRVRRLWIFRWNVSADVVALASDLCCHASLEELVLRDAALDTAAAIGAVVEACVALRLRSLELGGCRFAPATLPQLTRLVVAGGARQLIINNDNHNGVALFDEAHESTRLFVDAVRASAMTKLQLVGVGVLPVSVAEAAAFINARRQ